MSRYSRLFRLDESIPDDGSQRIPVSRWPVICVSNYGGDRRNETEYFPQLPDLTIIPGIYRARFDAAMAVYAASEGAQ